jgi:integrase
MNTLRDAIEQYLQLRHDLGFKLTQAQRWLREFADFMEQKQAPHITTERALEWALQPTNGQPAYWAKRLTAIRVFARYHSATDPCTEVPPDGLLPYRPRRAKPYPYTEGEINRLMQAAAALPPPDGLRGKTYACLIGLLIVTGLRIGEALGLTPHDVDLQTGLLTIRGAKFDKSRLVPVHDSTQAALSTYARQRDQRLGRTTPHHFFVTAHGKPLAGSNVRRTFRGLCRQIGLHGSATSDEPRLHHFRHRFATQTLLQWYQSGEDVEQQLPILSTFLGHARISDTYWYLSARPELMKQALIRLERRWENVS